MTRDRIPIPDAVDIAEPPRCQYCARPAALVDSSIVYRGRSFGMIWDCRPCDAYVGVHDGTTKPLGLLANRELRKARMEAHAAFDPIWRMGGMTRKQAYTLMAHMLQIGPARAHISMLTLQECWQLRAKALVWRGRREREQGAA